MPRSRDGRWTKQCTVCGQSYQQRKPTQVTCSVACRGKLPHNTGGVRPKAGLAPRKCIVCGEMFVPMREVQSCCSPACYRKSPRWRELQRRNDARPERRERQAELRRIADAVNEDRREFLREYNLRRNLASKYGITADGFMAMLAAQDSVCAICGQPPKPDGIKAASRLHVDHDHLTGKVRALLCNNCNRAIGYFADDPARMRAAAEYIERHRQEASAS